MSGSFLFKLPLLSLALMPVVLVIDLLVSVVPLVLLVLGNAVLLVPVELYRSSW